MSADGAGCAAYRGGPRRYHEVLGVTYFRCRMLAIFNSNSSINIMARFLVLAFFFFFFRSYFFWLCFLFAFLFRFIFLLFWLVCYFFCWYFLCCVVSFWLVCYLFRWAFLCCVLLFWLAFVCVLFVWVEIQCNKISVLVLYSYSYSLLKCETSVRCVTTVFSNTSASCQVSSYRRESAGLSRTPFSSCVDVF